MRARGSIFGLTRGTRAAHLARAALEAIACQSVEVLYAMESDAGMRIDELRVDGGGTVNDLLMQCQADLLDVGVVRPAVTETTALGAAYLAGLAVGYWPDVATLRRQWWPARRFAPAGARHAADATLAGWRRAVNAAKVWADAE